MGDVILYLSMVVAGYIAGTFVRRIDLRLPWLAVVITAIVVLLVFTMGMRIGANGEVVSNLNFIGLYALVFTVFILLFTLLTLYAVRRFLHLNRYGMVERAPGSQSDAVKSGLQDEANSPKIDRMTLFILGAVTCGILVGLALLGSGSIEFELVNAHAAIVIRVGLCVLLGLIGLDMGIEGGVVKSIRDAGLRILVVPAAVIVGTLAASALCSIFLPLSLRECLAVGAGFGWYSLAPGVIMDQGFIIAGAVSFLHNMMREIMAILIVPVVARHVGYFECSGLGGATTMDVGLPIVERSTNSITAVYAFVSGLVLTVVVPVLVPLIVAS